MPARTRHLVARHRRTGELVCLEVRDDRVSGYLRLERATLPSPAELRSLAYRRGAAVAGVAGRLEADYELWAPLGA